MSEPPNTTLDIKTKATASTIAVAFKHLLSILSLLSKASDQARSLILIHHLRNKAEYPASRITFNG
jgi:hypothetical protein